MFSRQGDFLATPPNDGLEMVRRSWVSFLVVGLALIALGTLAVGAAFVATLATVTVFGALLLVSGGVEVINTLWAHRWRGFFVHLLAGVLYAVLGLLMLEHPVEAAAGVTLWGAAALLVGGLVRAVFSAVYQFSGWGWSACSGVVSLLLGVLIWRQWPASGLWVIGLFVGIELIVNGWTWLMLALGLRNLAGRVHGQATPAAFPTRETDVVQA